MAHWTVQAADAIEKTVVAVRDRTVAPAQKAARAIVYGVLAGCCVLVAVLLLAIVGFRVITLAVPVWATWMLLGGIFIAAGLLCWSRRTSRSVHA